MTPSLNHQCPKSRSYSIKGDQTIACSLDSQEDELSSGVPLWQSSVTPPCSLPHRVRRRERWSLSNGACAPLHPLLSPCLFSPSWRQEGGEGWNEGPVCLQTGGSTCWYAALCLTPAQIPAHISTSVGEGKAAVCPWELQFSGCLPPRHTWGIEELSSKTLSNTPRWQRTPGGAVGISILSMQEQCLIFFLKRGMPQSCLDSREKFSCLKYYFISCL